MGATALACGLILIVQVSVSVNGNELSSTLIHRVRTLPHVSKEYSELEWKKIFEALAPKSDSLDAKPIEQPTGAGKLSQSANISPLIVGGSDATVEQFPWQVYLSIDKSWMCGGSLILENWVLTAAHCAKDSKNFVATFGTIKISEKSAGYVVRTTNEVYVHPKYDSSVFINDIALLKYSDPIPLSNTIKLIALPPQADATKTYIGTVATVSGFGLTSDKSSISDILKFMPDTVISNSECVKWFGTSAVTSGSICTKTAKKASCNGDSGGPLVYLDASNTWRQIGIVSYGADAGCLIGPSVYSRVSTHNNWMSNTIGSDVSGKRDSSFTEPATPPTKAPVCSQAKFENIEACCNVPHAKKFVTFNKKEKSSCGLSEKGLDVFNVYTLNKYQGQKDNVLKASDAKLSKDMAKQACLVNCYLKEKGVVSSEDVISSEKLAAFMNSSTNALGSSWNYSFIALADECNSKITGLSTKPMFGKGKSSCNGQALLVVQCMLQKIFESCPDIMQDSKCLKDFDTFKTCANAAQLFK